MFMWTVSELSRLFTSSRSEEATDASEVGYDQLADLINSGALSIRREIYTQTPEPREAFPPTAERQAFLQAFAQVDSRAHSLLKWWAWNWLRRMGEIRPAYDFAIGEAMVDVAAPAIGIAAQCGDNEPGTALCVLREPEWRTLAVFPYPRHITVTTLSPCLQRERILEFEVFLLTVAMPYSRVRI